MKLVDGDALIRRLAEVYSNGIHIHPDRLVRLTEVIEHIEAMPIFECEDEEDFADSCSWCGGYHTSAEAASAHAGYDDEDEDD